MAAVRTQQQSVSCPVSVMIAVWMILGYAVMFIVWDIVSPFERSYAEGPVSVILGLRVFGLSAQLMHALQHMVAGSMAYWLWKMQRFGWKLVMFCVAYMLVSFMIWALIYQESAQALGLGLFYIVMLGILLALTFPHRKKFV